MRLRIQCMGDELGRFILYHGQSVMDFLQILNARIILKINSFRRKEAATALVPAGKTAATVHHG